MENFDEIISSLARGVTLQIANNDSRWMRLFGRQRKMVFNDDDVNREQALLKLSGIQALFDFGIDDKAYSICDENSSNLIWDVSIASWNLSTTYFCRINFDALTIEIINFRAPVHDWFFLFDSVFSQIKLAAKEFGFNMVTIVTHGGPEVSNIDFWVVPCVGFIPVFRDEADFRAFLAQYDYDTTMEYAEFFKDENSDTVKMWKKKGVALSYHYCF